MLRIQTQIARWSNKQFPHQTHLSKMKHLEKEIKELRGEIDRSSSFINLSEGLADCGMLLFGIADLYDIDLHKEIKPN